MRYIILAFLFASFSYCKAQNIEHWDSVYLKNWVDSSGTIPSGVDLRSLHLKTATIISKRYEEPKYDTLPCIMLLIDTTKHKSFYKEEGEVDNWNPAGMASGVTWTESLDWYYDHSAWWMFGYQVSQGGKIIKYLLKGKRELPKNFILWMAKELSLPKMPELRITDPMPH